jgi:hypothetical protein
MKGKIVKVHDNQYWVEIPGHATLPLHPDDFITAEHIFGESVFEIVENQKISGVVKYAKLQPIENRITRLEVINHAPNELNVGRLLTLYKEMGDFSQVELSYQDGGRTLKIFLS